MATFKVGQRVRIVNPEPLFNGPVGAEGVVIGLGPRHRGGTKPPYEYIVDVPTCPFFGMTQWRFYSWELAPLTDPKADEFIESVKRWGPLHEEPKVEPARRPVISGTAIFNGHTIVCTEQGVWMLSPEGEWTKIEPRLP